MTTTAMSNNNNNNNLTKNKSGNDDALADFALEVFGRARQLQHERTGLLSSQNAVKMAAMEYFERGLTDINNSIAAVRLFAGEGKEETIKLMLDRLGAVSSVAAVAAAAEKQEQPQPQQQQPQQQIEQQPRCDKPKQEQKEKEECIAP